VPGGVGKSKEITVKVEVLMRSFFATCLLVVGSLSLSAAAKDKPLQIHFLDVEGGQATLLVSPSGQSLLVDTGWPEFSDRDAIRIADAVKAAGLKRIDHVVITHYHTDHVGGVPQLLKHVKVGEFIDHGPNTENDELAPEGYAAYLEVLEKTKTKHIVAKPGDKIPVKGLDIQVVSSAGATISSALEGAGQANPNCASEPEAPVDPTENAASLGIFVKFGEFRFVDLGDLTKKKELQLVCPNNLLGTVDLFLISHHGFSWSNAKAMVLALHPKAAININSAKKGGDAESWQIVHDSPGLQDIWALHYADASGDAHNSPRDFIANFGEKEDGHAIQVSAQRDGTFTVRNTRNNFEKTYKK
jgi:beta-lactamase superfamily II metal-dependent hydrolase